MCDQVAANMIVSALYNKVHSKVSFTAFDVTLEVQAQLKKANLFDETKHRHSHLKGDIHKAMNSMVDSGLYCKQLRDVGAPEHAFVYYAIGNNPDNYIPLSRNDKATPHAIDVPSAIAPLPVPEKIVGPTDFGSFVNSAIKKVADDVQGIMTLIKADKAKGRKPDARGSVSISPDLIRGLGLNRGDKVYLKFENNQLFITKNEPIVPVKKYTVDKNDMVRITKAALEFVDLKSDFYEFEVKGEDILVKQAN